MGQGVCKQTREGPQSYLTITRRGWTCFSCWDLRAVTVTARQGLSILPKEQTAGVVWPDFWVGGLWPNIKGPSIIHLRVHCSKMEVKNISHGTSAPPLVSTLWGVSLWLLFQILVVTSKSGVKKEVSRHEVKQSPKEVYEKQRKLETDPSSLFNERSYVCGGQCYRGSWVSEVWKCMVWDHTGTGCRLVFII